MAEWVPRACRETAPLPAVPGEWCLARLDPALRVVAAEDTFAGLFGVSALELRHRGIFDFLPGEAVELAALVRAGHGECATSVTVFWPDGRALSAELSALVVPGSHLVLALAATEAESRRVRPMMLTRLEVRLLERLAAGDSTMRLAKSLGLSRQGVEYHVGLMVRRFGVVNRLSLLAKACSLGILDAGSWPPRVAGGFVERENLFVRGG